MPIWWFSANWSPSQDGHLKCHQKVHRHRSWYAPSCVKVLWKSCFSFLDTVKKRKKWTKNNNNNNNKELDQNQESSPLMRWSLISPFSYSPIAVIPRIFGRGVTKVLITLLHMSALCLNQGCILMSIFDIQVDWLKREKKIHFESLNRSVHSNNIWHIYHGL